MLKILFSQLIIIWTTLCDANGDRVKSTYVSRQGVMLVLSRHRKQKATILDGFKKWLGFYNWCNVNSFVFFFFFKSFKLWHPLLMIVLHYQTKTSIDFWYRRGLNLISLIQPLKILPIKLTGTHMNNFVNSLILLYIFYFLGWMLFLFRMHVPIKNQT